MDVRVQLEQKLGKGIGASSNEELFCALLEMTKQLADDKKQKETKKKNAMLADLAVGDTVLTTSGFYGVVIDIEDDTVIVEFGSNKNCRIPMQKTAVAAVEKPENSVNLEK